MSAPAPPHLSLMPDVDAGQASPSPQRSPQNRRRITAVSAHDDGQRTLVTVTDDRGGTAKARGGRHRRGQVAACARAVAQLFDASLESPDVVSVRRWEHEQQRFVTVILDVGGETRVGSAPDDGLELRAIAVAVWQALSA